MKIFGREPALIISVISASLSLLVTFQFGLSAEQAGAIVAVTSAVFAAATATITRPIAPSAFTGLVAAVVALLAAYGFNVTPETVGALNAVVLAVLGLLTRGQVSPTVPTTPATAEPSQGA
ncbi:hypothetical protein [Streptomyces acidicola]|uniref:Holin n=1 Tax=Streptomyces acidicola TaxID=2596892 RepID=A0A5N8WIM4_9ACTN|nr:hypothetical protein [Streptomyces acidicola]MPY47174.1 hypothetical protein [Streptomyces acidicola]MPY47313.1 hypothetical protein [Streptomyces acidicola]